MLSLAEPCVTVGGFAAHRAEFTLRRGSRADTIVRGREGSGTPIGMFPRRGFWVCVAGRPRLVDPTVVCVRNQANDDWIVSRCSPALFLDARRLVEFAPRGHHDPAAVDDLLRAVLNISHGPASHDGSRPQTPSPSSARRQALVDEAKARIAGACHRRHSLDDLCVPARCSSCHLSRTFREVEGMTLSEYGRQIRLRAAVDRLMGAAVSGLTQVALEFGFSSHSHFTEAFRRTFGLTPSQLLGDLRRAGR